MSDWVLDADAPRDLVPDFTNPGHERACDAQHPRCFVCTRRAGHTGRHAAGTGRDIAAVWS